MDSFSFGDSEQEIQYRRWCLRNRLFINPLNDIGLHPISAHDILTTPAIVVKIGEGPYYQGYFNLDYAAVKDGNRHNYMI